MNPIAKGLLGILSSGAGPIMNLIDKLKTTQEERGQLRLQFYQYQSELVSKALEYETALIQGQAKIVEAEALGKSWLQRNWRPGLMTLFGIIVGWNYLVVPVLGTTIALEPAILPDHLWQLLKIGVGGYIVGRSGEKIAKTLTGKELKFGKK